MQMPQYTPPPLSGHLDALREAVMELPLHERRTLMHALYGCISRQNDQRHQEAFERSERERNRKRPDSRQLALLEPRQLGLLSLEAG